MLLTIVNVVLPVFLVVGFGYLCGRKKAMDLTMFNVIVVDMFSPILIFVSLANREFDLYANRHLIVGSLVVVLGSGLLAWPLARLCRLPVKTLVPPMMFSNTANMGISLAVFAFGPAGLSPAVAMFAVCTLLHFSVGIKLLNRQATLAFLLRNPIMWAAALGVLVGLLHLTLPEPFMRAMRLMGEAAIPMALFSLGVRMTTTPLKNWRIGLLGAVLCPLLGLLVAGLCVWLLPLTELEKAQLLLFGSLPPAVLNYILAERYQQQPDLVASMVLLGNLAALVFVPIALVLGM